MIYGICFVRFENENLQLMEKTLEEKRKVRKKWFFGIGIILLVFISTPFALEFYLQRKLPDLINSKTPYKVKLKDFSLSVIKGNFSATEFSISTKNPKDPKITQINGTVKKIELQDLSIWKALFQKSYHANLLTLTKSTVKIKLAPKSKAEKKEKKPLDIHVNNIYLDNVFAEIIGNDGKPIFVGENIKVNLKDIKQSDNNAKIPIAFSEFKIDAKRVKIGVNDFYEIDADQILAANKTMELKKFHLKPLQKAENYNAKNIFDFYSENLLAKDFNINQDSLIVSDIIFKSPDLKVTSTGKNTVREDKNPRKVDMKIGLKNIDFQQGKIVVLKANQEKTASVDQFNFKLSDIVFDKNTVKEKIPFRFTNHDIEAENIYLKTDNLQALKIKKIVSKNSDITVDQLQLIALQKSANKDLYDIRTEKVTILDNKTKYIGQRLNLEFGGIDIQSPDIKIISSNHHKPKPKDHKSSPDYLAKIGFVKVSNGKIKQSKSGKQTLAVAKLDAYLEKISSNTSNLKTDLPFIIGKRMISAKGIDLDAGKYYTLKVAAVKNVGLKTDISNLKYIPKYSRAGFSKVIDKETDLYTISVKNIAITDHQSNLLQNAILDLDKVEISGLHCNIYHDLAPADDHDPRYLFSKKLRNVKMPLFIKAVSVKNSDLVYEENAQNNNIPGKLTFDNFDIAISNVNNGKITGRPTLITANANFAFFGTANTNVVWKFDVMDLQDKFTIKGDIQKLSAENVNLFVRPYLNITLDGNIDYLKFDYYGNNSGIAGNFYFKYNEMYVNLLNKKGKERKLLTKVANWFVKDESKGEPSHVEIEKKRDPDKSFFNLLWQGIMEGLKKYLI